MPDAARRYGIAIVDTIFALSSGAPPAAIAIVRVSGPAAGGVLRALAGRLPPARRATLRSLRDPDDASLLDRALTLWFPGPKTATGEDLVELHLHGGRAVIAAVTQAIARLPGVRAAEAGEFTRRALLNGRVTLTEVEGLQDLLLAETEAHRRAAAAAAGGAVARQVEAWRKRLLALSAEAEAALDFGDEDDVPDDPAALLGRIAVLAQDVGEALSRPSIERLRDGIRVVIAGPPNTGKSTLLNALANRDVAIVSDVPGTTRDVLEVPLAIAGVPLLVMDTAGQRHTADRIEAEGVGRARQAQEDADILLWLGDCPPPRVSATVVRLHARADRPEPRSSAADISLSVIEGWGVGALIERLVELADTIAPIAGDAVSYNRRQRYLLRRVHGALLRCSILESVLLIAEELREGCESLNALIGRTGVEDMLDTLFSGFCIGK